MALAKHEIHFSFIEGSKYVKCTCFLVNIRPYNPNRKMLLHTTHFCALCFSQFRIGHAINLSRPGYSVK
jgi:hypothetical protein